MAKYTGQITLININDPEGQAGVGIKSTQVYYAISTQSDNPPDLAGVTLETTDNDILTFSQVDTTFIVTADGVLKAQQAGTEIPLITSSQNITGAGNSEWSTVLPKEVPQGAYLWTKTIFYYTDESQTVSYSVTYQGSNGTDGKDGTNGKDGVNGKDGADGKDGDTPYVGTNGNWWVGGVDTGTSAQGPMGPSGDANSAFVLKTNQSEILKFVSESEEITLSPNLLTVGIYRADVGNQEGFSQLTNVLLSGLSLKIYDNDTSAWIDMDNTEKLKIITLLPTGTFEINLLELKNLSITNEASDFDRIFSSSESIIRITYNHTENDNYYTVEEFLSVRYGMTKDMAMLNVKANGIVASMQNSKLTFNSNGLTIQNGNLLILDSTNQKLLYADENGNLCLKGNIYADDGYFSGELKAATGSFSGSLEAASGTFTGRLEAATGSFSGDITAATGNIGGFKIDAAQLTSISENDYGLPNIILNGADGVIEVENIILGTGAQIKEYIQIGEQVELRKVNSNLDSFILVNNGTNPILDMKANGVINVGYGDNTIIISGEDGSIMTQNYINNTGWKISNTEAVFNNVKIRGSIHASVLEYEETQAIGGVLIVRPSSIISNPTINTANNTTTFTVESAVGFNTGDYCRIDTGLVHNYYIITGVNEKQITISGVVSDIEGYPVVSFGRNYENNGILYNTSVGIGINGSTDSALIRPNSISVFDFDEASQTIKTHIILGKLPDEPAYGFARGTYGLYAENVLLKGSLVTQTETGSGTVYSGISTLYSGSDSPTSDGYKQWFGENTGEILLWAGAEGTDRTQVENSNFIVDKNGNLVAKSGYFKGTIITDATITASMIETAKLRGKGDAPALVIEDARSGIVFNSTNSETDDSSFTVFEVNKEKITAQVPEVIFNNNFKITSTAKTIIPNLYITGNSITIAQSGTQKSALMFDKHKITYTNDFQETSLEDNPGNSKSYIDFQDGLAFSPDGENKVLNITTSQVQVEKDLYIENIIKYNELMEYRPMRDNKGVLIGYDLYIE